MKKDEYFLILLGLGTYRLKNKKVITLGEKFKKVSYIEKTFLKFIHRDLENELTSETIPSIEPVTLLKEVKDCWLNFLFSGEYDIGMYSSDIFDNFRVHFTFNRPVLGGLYFIKFEMPASGNFTDPKYYRYRKYVESGEMLSDILSEKGINWNSLVFSSYARNEIYKWFLKSYKILSL